MRQELINEELRESADWLFCTLSPGMIPCGRTSLFGAFKQKKKKKSTLECLSVCPPCRKSGNEAGAGLE